MMRLQILLSSSLYYILPLTTPAQCSSDIDFSAYPASARTCLEEAASDSTCTGDTVATQNQCLCSNTGNLVLNTAACIGDLSGDILTEVYELMQEGCSNAKTPLTVSEADWFRASNGTTVTVTSTITTTSAGVLTTFTTTSTSSHIASIVTATGTSASSDQASSSGMTASAKIGAITSSVAGALTIACVACLVIMLKKRRMDKKELREALKAGRSGDGGRDNDKSLLDPGAMTPGISSPAGPGYEATTLGASVIPPAPSHSGPVSPQVWRSLSQTAGRGTPVTPSELPGYQQPYELPDSRGRRNLTQWPSPVSQGMGTMGSWCPSPVSTIAHSNTLGAYDSGTSTGAPISTLSTPLSGQTTGPGTMLSSWAHERPIQEEPFELPGNEALDPIEADSIPLTRSPERQSMMIRPAPPEYTAGGWVDPITDKPPI